MKRLLLFVLLSLPSAGWTCGPDLPDPHVSAAQRFRQTVGSTPNIIYGVVEQDITTSRPGIMRVTHVYKGSLRVGQRVPMRYVVRNGCVIVPDSSWRKPRGAQGVVFINTRSVEGILPFTGFMAREDFERQVRESRLADPR